jgi:hypothetical protein
MDFDTLLEGVDEDRKARIRTEMETRIAPAIQSGVGGRLFPGQCRE